MSTITKTIPIDGMSCNHCVRHVENALKATEGVTVDSVQIGSATIQFDPESVSRETLSDVIEDAGYHAQI
jgi:copper chaperone